MSENIEWLREKALNLYPSQSEMYKLDLINSFIDLIDELDKPEKMVIPQFVADWYEENLSGGHTDNRNKFSGNDVFRVIQDVLETSKGFKVFENYGIDKKIATWAEENEEDFIHLIVNCSYKEGYEIEKEKMYYVSVRDEEYGGFWFLTKNSNGSIAIGVGIDWSEVNWDRLKLTEQEIKDYGERFWAIAKEVME